MCYKYMCKLLKCNIIIKYDVLQDQFVEEIYSSGMLIYVSRNWLAELYQHILVTNILVLSCYKTQAAGHLALIDLLTGLYGVSLQAWFNKHL